jgi:protein involved in polysaccharide export with SLBB domain
MVHRNFQTRAIGVAIRAVALWLAAWTCGCAALTNPVADGIPVHRLPEEIFPAPREDLKPLPLTLLRQEKPAVYRLGPGDILGVYIENLLGDKSAVPPVRLSETGNVPPSLGYPVPIQGDGTIAIPFADPIQVSGMSLDEARAAIRKAVTETKQLVPKDRARIYVTLMQQRRYHVIVVRQDTGGLIVDPQGILGGTKRGSGFPIDLPAYENDVLNALARTGGLPGLDANNEIIIQRGPPANAPRDKLPAVGETVRIPLRVRADEPLTFRPDDVILRDGDIVFIEARDTELFYTGGLLPAGEYVLPRDYDLDVVEAVARVRGPLVNGGFNQSNQFSQQLLASGMGFPSPSLLSVIRKTCNGRQITIRVDLNRALRDPRERILVQPGDILILQEKPSEAIVRYLNSILRLNYLFSMFRSERTAGTATVNFP